MYTAGRLFTRRHTSGWRLPLIIVIIISLIYYLVLSISICLYLSASEDTVWCDQRHTQLLAMLCISGALLGADVKSYPISTLSNESVEMVPWFQIEMIQSMAEKRHSSLLRIISILHSECQPRYFNEKYTRLSGLSPQSSQAASGGPVWSEGDKETSQHKHHYRPEEGSSSKCIIFGRYPIINVARWVVVCRIGLSRPALHTVLCLDWCYTLIFTHFTCKNGYCTFGELPLPIRPGYRVGGGGYLSLEPARCAHADVCDALLQELHLLLHLTRTHTLCAHTVQHRHHLHRHQHLGQVVNCRHHQQWSSPPYYTLMCLANSLMTLASPLKVVSYLQWRRRSRRTWCS